MTLPLEQVSPDGKNIDPAALQRDLNAISQYWPNVPGAPVSTLTGITPYDGMEINYLADSTNGIIWRLRYRSASASSFKWEFVGGSALNSGIAGNITTASAAFVAMTTSPTITFPLAGDYEIVFNLLITAQAAGINNMLADLAVGGVDSGLGVTIISTAQFQGGTVERTIRLSSVAASGVLSVIVRSANSLSSAFQNAQLLVRPVRVG